MKSGRHASFPPRRSVKKTPLCNGNSPITDPIIEMGVGHAFEHSLGGWTLLNKIQRSLFAFPSTVPTQSDTLQ